MQFAVDSQEKEGSSNGYVLGYAFSILHEYQKAIDNYEAYIKTHPNSTKKYIALNNQGNAYYYLGDFARAVTAYETALEAAVPSDAEQAIINYNLANALIGVEEDSSESSSTIPSNANTSEEFNYRSLLEEKVIKQYQKAIELNPSLLEAYNNLASLSSHQQEHKDLALRSLEDALRLGVVQSPSEDTQKIATLHFNLANLMYQKISTEIMAGCEITRPRSTNSSSLVHPATERMMAEIETCGDDRQCKQEVVRRWQEMLKQQSSPRNVNQFPPTKPTPIDLQQHRREREECLHENFEKFASAIQHYKAAIELNPEFLEAHNNLGNLYLESSLFEQAIEHFRQALNLDQKALFVRNNLGVAFFKSGQIAQGKEQYEIVKQLREDFLQSEDSQAGTPGGQSIAVSAELECGRIAEWSSGYGQSLRMSSVGRFQPDGSQDSVPTTVLWNINRLFDPINIPIANDNQIDSLLAYTFLPEEEFQNPKIKAPVVRILATVYKDLLDGNRPNVGTGFLISKDAQAGYVLTAYHTLLTDKNISDPTNPNRDLKIECEADEIVVQFFTPLPKVSKAHIVLRGLQDTGVSDLALLKVENVPAQIPEVNLATSVTPQQGEEVMAVGHSDNQQWQVSTLQFDTINPDQTWSFRGTGIKSGNSGGPVYQSTSGEVIAMLVVAEQDKEVSRAIPVRAMTKILQKIQSD